MRKINKALDLIVSNYCEILKEKLVGIYLHGSLAMNCFNINSSDIDFLVIIKEDICFKVKRKLIDVLLKLSENIPKNGFEMSVILEKDVKKFIYPTPFILHYSDYYKHKYINDENFICGNSTDPDLAAHIVITIERGRCLFGKPIREVFQPIPQKYYAESIMGDIENATEGIINNPIYYILNLCRVLCYIKEDTLCSKAEGGKWGINNLSYPYIDTIKLALIGYESSDSKIKWNQQHLAWFADYMVNEIKSEYTFWDQK